MELVHLSKQILHPFKIIDLFVKENKIGLTFVIFYFLDFKMSVTLIKKTVLK